MEVVITGTSSGIGRALAEHYLAKGKIVHGISRRKTIEHPNYVHQFADLSENDFISQLQFEPGKDYLLINNAGVLGKVSRLSQADSSDIAQVFSVNLFAAVKLMQFFAKLTGLENQLTVVNISSGAGRSPLPSWLSYCSSKAALDMASKVFYLEEKELGKSTRVYSVAPGVVDTPMQAEIRHTNQSDFSAHARFTDYKKQNELTDPVDLGEKLDKLLKLACNGEILYSLRDF